MPAFLVTIVVTERANHKTVLSGLVVVSDVHYYFYQFKLMTDFPGLRLTVVQQSILPY